MRYFANKAAVSLLGLALATVPLTGCFGGGDKGGDSSSDDTTETVEVAADDYGTMGQRTPTGNADYTTWKTLGDAFAAAEEDPSYGYDASCYAGVIKAGGKAVYVAAQMTPDVFEKAQAVDMLATDSVSKTEEALSTLPIGFIDDITDKQVPQAELDAFVGKTGQDLVNAGYTFLSYFMYGGEQTGGTFGNGYYSYDFTFDASVSEAAIEDGGASIMGATIVSVSSGDNLSDDIFSPENIAQVTGGAVVGAAPVAEAVPADGTAVTPDETLPSDATLVAPAATDVAVETAPVQ